VFVSDPEFLVNLNFKRINPEPSLAIIDNPFDNLGKLLLVIGANGNAHKTGIYNLIDNKKVFERKLRSVTSRSSQIWKKSPL
jgi:hypothetical protein